MTSEEALSVALGHANMIRDEIPPAELTDIERRMIILAAEVRRMREAAK